MATYYINADTGDDTTGDGSQGNPWLTPAKGFSEAASSGDTIFCQNSTANFEWPTIGNVNKEITFEGESVTGVVFSAGNALKTFNCRTAVISTFKNITFSDLLVTGAQTGGWDIETEGVQVDFYNCIFKDNSIQATRCGIIWFRNNGENSPVNFTSCLFYDNIGTGGSSLIGNGAQSSLGGSFLNFYNTVIDFNGSTGSELGALITRYGGTGITTTYTNSIVVNNQTNVVDLSSYYTNTANYSCIYGSFSSPPTGNNNITSDPLFIDVDNNDYNLSPSSPCIDAGTLI
jgi:hypothetical protein